MYVWKHLKHCHHIISIMRSHLEANCHIVILVTYHLPLFHLIFVFNRLCHIILPCHIISTLSPSYLLTLFLPSFFFATSPHFITSFHFFFHVIILSYCIIISPWRVPPHDWIGKTWIYLFPKLGSG